MELTNDVMVSVWCLAYNHEKYIRKTLEGFVSQVTDFKYEVIVHDDASTDGTAAIIREYAEKYPDIIKPVFQTENQYSKGGRVIYTLFPELSKGKYVAFCEGDDYWCDTAKLQSQFDILEKNPDCSVCLHKVNIINEKGDDLGSSFPRYEKLKTGIIEQKEYISLVLFTRTLLFLQFQLSCLMIRKDIILGFKEENPVFRQLSDVGDLPLFLYSGTKGNAYYIDKTMSCYRSGALGSWNNNNNAIQKRIDHLKLECRVLKEFDEYSGHIAHESAVKGIQNREFQILRLNHDIKGMKKMSEFYGMMPMTSKLKEYLCRYAPGIYSFIKKIRGGV